MSWTSTLQKARTKFAVAGLPGVLAALRGRWYRRNQVYRKQFNDNGYLRLERFVEPSVCDRITREAEAFYARRGVPADKADRTMNFHQESPTANQVLHEQRLLDVIGALLGAPALFLQSIYFNRGSEQNAHSDYIYMSTEPDFHLCGFWLACEDITADAGPLIYYPRSHLLPVQNVKNRYRERIESVRAEIRAHEAELTGEYRQRMAQTQESLLTCFFYDKWLDEIYTALEEGRYPKETLLAKKGDVLIWHANLVHGGSPVTNQNRTRKTLVAHYLTEAVVHYFDMNYVDRQVTLLPKWIDHQRPAVLQVRG